MFLKHKNFIINVFAILLVVGSFQVANAESWIHPTIAVRETFDDNIFLTDGDEENDWITTVMPGVVFEPPMNKHKFTADYVADLNIYAENTDQNNYNHTTNQQLELNFNKVKLDLKNRFRWFENRTGSEDTERIPRTQDHASAKATFDFNKLDFSVAYYLKYENYRSDRGIGAFEGRSLSYQDLDRQDHMGEAELAFKLWPKTSLLLSGDIGTIYYRTQNKADSLYFDALIGIRGKLTAKSTVEAKVGFRGQYFEDQGNDYNSLVFNGSYIGNLSTRDTLRLDFIRTTNATIQSENAYYGITFAGGEWEHGFNNRWFGTLGGSYQLDDYPTAILVPGGSELRTRMDHIISAGVGLGYELPWGLKIKGQYDFRVRESNFNANDYQNNKGSVTVSYKF